MFGLGIGLFTIGAVLFFMLIICLAVLKGYALWNSAKRDEVGWFIVLLVINTFGILELIYLYFVVGKWKNRKN
jgi:methionyl-tRNA synthetase